MHTPTYDEISSRAQSLWRDWGCPEGRDTEIWLEAERLLRRCLPSTDASKSDSFVEQTKAETAAESVVEYQISPAGSDEEAIRAALQKQNPRAPKSKPLQFGRTLSKKLRPPQN